jgi:dihydroorotate dehydrogenase electron transfer subunit
MIKDSQARIVGKKSWNSYYLLSLESPRIAAQSRPGQFIMVRISPEPYPLLRRPFSIHSKDEKSIDIFFQVSGLGTDLLSQKKEDDILDVLGPLGKGFNEEASPKGKDVVAVGGGRGIAPLYFLAKELRSHGASVKIFYGGKSLQDIPLKEKFERGPEEMMKKIARIAAKRNIPAEFSLESVMGCGFGVCWGCVKRIKKNGEEGWVKICEEGPVFSSDDIIWKEEEE